MQERKLYFKLLLKSVNDFFFHLKSLLQQLPLEYAGFSNAPTDKLRVSSYF